MARVPGRAAGRDSGDRLSTSEAMRYRITATIELVTIACFALSHSSSCAKARDASRAAPVEQARGGSSSASSVAAASTHERAPGDKTTAPVEAASPAKSDEPRLTLLVSNQSSTLPKVDIQVLIDGRRVVDDTFALGMGHSVKRYELHLSTGHHDLRATANGGTATYDGSIDMQGERWGALLFWRRPTEGVSANEQRPAFTFDVQDSPIQLR
jgi:hypothetical protein